MSKYRFAGYRVVGFSNTSKNALAEIAARLIPHRRKILDTWVRRQCAAWQPPGLTRADLRKVFGDLLDSMLNWMEARDPAKSLRELEEAGRDLAARRFPFEALIISVHFLEQSYMPLLLNGPPEKTQSWFVSIDEFLHAALAAIADSYFHAYRRELMEEVEVGRVVQEGLLADIPRQAADLEVAHVYISAHEKAKLGGDFIDSFTLDRGRMVFTIGDLSGHGLEAAADSVTIRSLFRGFMREAPDLAEVMCRVSNVLADELRSDQFATMLAAIYDSAGSLSMVSAGHPFPVLCDGQCRMLEIGGTALGIGFAPPYTASAVEMPMGSTFVAYTDGLIEARDQGDQFGEDRLMATIQSVHRESARTIADHLIDESLRHAGGTFSDDVAVLVLKRGIV